MPGKYVKKILSHLVLCGTEENKTLFDCKILRIEKDLPGFTAIYANQRSLHLK
jgi:hypothetical protein